ncbi:MAG: hypothetical protein AB7F59_03935 [Bdellovibrionales bacterium]
MRSWNKKSEFIEKIKQNQAFATSDLLLVLGSICLVLIIVIPILLKGAEGSRVEKAQREMRKFTQESTFLQLAMYHPKKSSRSLASVSPIVETSKHDPWGHPYKMDTIVDHYGQPSFFVIWSPGPNGIIETPQAQPILRSGRVQLQFLGDDLGYAIALK